MPTKTGKIFALRGAPAAPVLRLEFFDGFRLLIRGNETPFRVPMRVVELLAYLIFTRDRNHNRRCIAARFWPDAEPATRLANLRRHLYTIVRNLPPAQCPYLLSDERTVRWNPAAPCSIDLVEFEAQRRQPSLRAAAVDLYRGDVLPDSDEEEIFVMRETFREALRNVLCGLIDEAEAAYDWESAVPYALRLVSLDPFADDGAVRLMRLRAARGDRGGALLGYRRFAQALRAEFDIEPLTETTRLFESIRTASDAWTAAKHSTAGA